MKTVSLDSPKLTVQRLLRAAGRGDVVFLTRSGNTRYALVKADDADRETCALRSNPDFMAHLTTLERRARRRPRRTLAEVRERLQRNRR